MHEVVVQGGARIRVRELRAGSSARTAILIHALAMDGTMWAAAAQGLQTTARIVAIDVRGHGESSKTPGPYTTGQMAQDLHDVANRLGIDRFVLGGCSMGGTIAQAFAGRWSDRLNGLLLVDTTAWYGPDARQAWASRAERALQNGLASMQEFQLERWFSSGFKRDRPDVVSEALARFLSNDVQAYAFACGMLGSADERATLSAYRGPATIMVGEFDQATPLSAAEQLADLLPGSRLVTIPGARHFTPYEAPDVIARELDRLLLDSNEGENT
jgi:3-oxoadipate enol-lactonase